MLEEESRAKIKEVLGLDQTDEIKAKQIAILKILASKPMSCGNTDEFNKVEILKGPKQSICRCCLIRKECNSLIGSKGSNDSVLKERQAIALEKYNRIMLRKQLGLLDPNDSQKSGACDMEESYDESGNKEEGGKSS
jgi:hypothetical protein